MARSVEVEGASVEEATLRALDELGLSPHEVTVEVLAQARRGLFGAGRRVHLRVTEKKPGAGPDDDQPKDLSDDLEDRVAETETTEPDERLDEDTTEAEKPLSPEERLDQLDEEAELAADFVEGLLDLLDLPGDIEIEVQEDQALVTVQDVGSGLLIGRRGSTLDALQELVRSAVQRQTERRSHVRVDVEGYRARQLEKLRDKCREAIAEVRETGQPTRLEPMDAYERKMMHDLVGRTGGVTSSSEGAEPKRRVVIHPAP